MKNGKDKDRSIRYIFFYIILFVIEVIWGCVALKTGLLHKSSKNIFYFAAAILLCCISYIAFELTIPDKWRISGKCEKLFSCVLFLLLGLLTAVIFVKPYICGTFSGLFSQGDMPLILEMLFFIGAAAVALLFFACPKIKIPEINKWFRFGLYTILAGATVWSLCRTNVFDGDLYHFDAYYHSVYKAYQLQAYSEVNSGIYGFYGILLLPLTRIAGISYDTIIVIMAILNGLTLACFFYVLENLLSSTWMKVVAAVSLSSFAVWERTGLYCQMFPHRILFGGIILAYISWGIKHKKNKACYQIMGIVISMLAIVWNLEIGLAVTLAFTASCIVELCKEFQVTQMKWWLYSIRTLLILPIAFLGAYATVGVYNILTGGAFLPLKVFLFPLVGAEQNFIDTLYIELPVQVSPWMGCLAIILVCAVFVMKQCFFRNAVDGKTVVLCAAAVLGAVQMVYYVNRASYLCLYIIMPVMGLLMGWLAEKNRISEGTVHRTLFAWITTVLVMMSIAFPVRFVIQQKAYGPQRNMEKVEQLAQKVKDLVPPDTIGFGEGVDEIYSYLGWNANYFGMDLPDIIYSNEVCVDYIFELIETADCIFVNDDSLNTLSYYLGDNTWKEEVFLKEYTCIADIYYDEGSKYNYRLYKKLK